MGEGNIEKRFAYKKASIWHIAAIGKEEKHIAVLEWLLHKFRYEITADVLNQQEGNYLTPCHYAAMVGNIKALQLLVSYGAVPTAKNDLNYTPRDLLKEPGYKHLVYQLDNIIAHKELLQEQIRQAEPTQCLFSPLRNLLQQRDKPDSSDREMVTYRKNL